jgi:hypothetical protein
MKFELNVNEEDYKLAKLRCPELEDVLANSVVKYADEYIRGNNQIAIETAVKDKITELKAIAIKDLKEGLDDRVQPREI